jgi:renalase
MGLNIAIVGAGVAGVAAAQALKQRGHTVTIYEKSRGFGGRCATKVWEGCVVDHGTPHFSLGQSGFRAAALAACGSHLRTIGAPVLSPGGREIPGPDRWYHRAGNSNLVRELARGVEVKTGVVIQRADQLLEPAGGGYDHVICTAPFPQTAELCGIGSVVNYTPCLAAILAYDGEGLGLTATAHGIQDLVGPLGWSACENHKPDRIPPGRTVLVAHMSEAFSRENLETSTKNLPDLIRPYVEARWKLPSRRYLGGLGHRWRFARAEEPKGPIHMPDRIYYAGDAWKTSTVENAWIAGNMVADLPLFRA